MDQQEYNRGFAARPQLYQQQYHYYLSQQIALMALVPTAPLLTPWRPRFWRPRRAWTQFCLSLGLLHPPHGLRLLA